MVVDGRRGLSHYRPTRLTLNDYLPFTIYHSLLLNIHPVLARPDLDFERHVELYGRLHLALEYFGDLFGLLLRGFDEQLVVHLHDHLRLEARRAQSLVTLEHGD